MSTSGAFTIDVVDYEGTILDAANPLTITVPGFGSVTFQAINGASLPVDRSFENDTGSGAPSLTFDSGETIRITFDGATVQELNFEFAGISIGESFAITDPALFNPQATIVRLDGQNGRAGITSMSWTAVPEPSAAVLGLVGTLLLFRRRR